MFLDCSGWLEEYRLHFLTTQPKRRIPDFYEWCSTRKNSSRRIIWGASTGKMLQFFHQWLCIWHPLFTFAASTNKSSTFSVSEVQSDNRFFFRTHNWKKRNFSLLQDSSWSSLQHHRSRTPAQICSSKRRSWWIVTPSPTFCTSKTHFFLPHKYFTSSSIIVGQHHVNLFKTSENILRCRQIHRNNKFFLPHRQQFFTGCQDS